MKFYQNVKRDITPPVDLTVLGNTYNTLQQGHIKALELKTQLETAVSQLEMDPSEDAYKAQLVDGITQAVDNNSVGGNLYYSLPEIIKQQGNIAKNPGVLGRVRANAARKAFIGEVNKMDVDEDIKAMAIEMSPYYYEDKLDSKGNVVGGSEWAPGYTPVKQIDFNKLITDAIKIAHPDKGKGTGAIFMDSDGNRYSQYVDGTDAYVWSETTMEYERLSPEKLQAAILNAIQNTPGAMASLNQDRMVGVWKANKIQGDDEESINAKIAASNGALDENGVIKSFNRYISDRINPSIYAAQYDNKFVTTKYHNDAIKAAAEKRNTQQALANLALGGNAFGELPSQAGPIAIVKDSSASDSALSVSQLNQDIKKRLRDAGVEEKNLGGILYNDINKISELLNATNNPNSATILKEIQREIQLKGDDIEFYNQLQNSNISKKAQEALIFQSAIDGGIDPNELNQSKDNRYINRYNALINDYVGDGDGLVYQFNEKRINDIIDKYGGEQKLINAGYQIRIENNGNKTIIIPKEIIGRSQDLFDIIKQSENNPFHRKGKFGKITNGDINLYYTKTSPDRLSQSFGMFYGEFNRIQRQAARQTSKSTNINQEIEVPTSVSPTSSPMMYALAVLRDSAPDKKTRDYYNALMTDKKQLLENEINGLDFRTGNYTIIDENGRTKELDDKEKRAYQAKWDAMKASGYKFSADNALMYTNPWTGESYTYLSVPLDKDESVRVVFDKGRWAQEFNNLNASFTRQADAALYRSSRNKKPIQVGFVEDSNMMLRYDKDDTYGNHYYDLTLGDNIIRKDLDAEEARNYMYVYQLLLSLGDGFRTLDVTKPSANPKMTNGQYIEAYIEQLAKNYEPFYGSQSEDIVRSILGF